MEYLDVYTSSGDKTGKIISRDNVFSSLSENERILLVHVCLFNSSNEMLIQQRQLNKDRYPGCWDVSAGGFVSSGETPVLSSLRELKEELGTEAGHEEFLFVCCEPFGKVLDYFYLIYAEPKPDELSLQPEEVAAVRWASEEEVISMIRNGKFVDYSEELIKRIFEFAKKSPLTYAKA